eukprot:6759384-Prymnesium_polylepis.1
MRPMGTIVLVPNMYMALTTPARSGAAVTNVAERAAVIPCRDACEAKPATSVAAQRSSTDC